MTYRLLNSAMMPAEGTYTLRRISANEFGRAVCNASLAGELRSYIGYEQTAKFVSRLAKVDIPVSREQTVLNDGDVLLIIRLRYRVTKPETKGEAVTEDFEFFRAEYQE